MMAKDKLPLPVVLRRIDREKADELVGVSGDVLGDVRIIDPHPAEPGLAAEDDGRHIRDREPLIVFPADGQIQLHAGPGAAGLPAKVITEVLRVAPSVAMDIDDRHGYFSFFSPNGSA